MNQNKIFLVNKLARQLKCNGSSYTFERKAEDKYHQKTGAKTLTTIDKAIYHESNSYVQISTSDGARVKSKPQPMLLMTHEDGLKLNVDDIVIISLKAYKVTGMNNIQNYDVAADVSLEMIV